MIFSKSVGGINGVARNANVVIVPSGENGIEKGLTDLNDGFLSIQQDVIKRKLQGKVVLALTWYA